MQSLIEKANILMEALPYIQLLHGKTIVVKYGGNAMKNPSLVKTILQDITLLKYVGANPIVVHGGGPEINQMLDVMNIKSEFHNGLRITSAEAIEVVQMVLAGKVNKSIVSQINALGGKAVGLCGKDGNLIEAVRMPADDGVDLGFVGQVTSINVSLLNLLAQDQYIPVIAPVGTDAEGNSYNINADTVASEIAIALKAEKLIYLTDIDGILLDSKDPFSIISAITVREIREYIADGRISGGMIPKAQACAECAERGIKRVHIINGTISHPIILEIFTDRGIGTMVTMGA